MKKLLTITAALLLAGIVGVQADNCPSKKKSAEQKAIMKELLGKYDANKDGKLCEGEKSKLSAEDKEKLKKCGAGECSSKKKDA